MGTYGKSMTDWSTAPLFSEETRARAIPAPAATEIVKAPTSPDISLPWLEDFSLNGWSARMFLHQLLTTSQPAWSISDTEQLLFESTPLKLRANLGSGISLSAVVGPIANTFDPCFRTAQMVQGLIRRALARGRSLRLLLLIEQDTIPVIVTFGSRNSDYASWRLKSEKDLPDFLADGLLDFLKQHAPSSTGTL